MPFLEGVPCSIHGLVLPDGTAVFRPVELAILRGPDRRFVYGGLGTTWDPPDRPTASRCATWPGVPGSTCGGRRATGARSASTASSPPTASGRPSSTRGMSGGLASMARVVDAPLFHLLQFNLLAGRDPGVDAASLEAWALPRMDAPPVRRRRSR